MQPYERNLFIVMCLGHELTGNESTEELADILDRVSETSHDQPVLPTQEEVAQWIGISLAHCQNRQAASVRLWDRIKGSGYSLADVPVRLRRQAFGGSLEIQKRLGRRPWHQRLLRTVGGILKTLITLAMVAAGIWFALTQLR